MEQPNFTTPEYFDEDYYDFNNHSTHSSSTFYDVVSFWVNGVFSLALVVVGTLGNGAVVSSLHCKSKSQPKRPRQAFYFYLMTFAFWNTGLLIATVLFNCVPVLTRHESEYRVMGDVSFLIGYPLGNCCLTANIWLAVVVTIERYLAVSLPFHSTRLTSPRRRAKLISICLSLGAVLYNLPLLFELSLNQRAAAIIENSSESPLADHQSHYDHYHHQHPPHYDHHRDDHHGAIIARMDTPMDDGNRTSNHYSHSTTMTSAIIISSDNYRHPGTRAMTQMTTVKNRWYSVGAGLANDKLSAVMRRLDGPDKDDDDGGDNEGPMGLGPKGLQHGSELIRSERDRRRVMIRDPGDKEVLISGNSRSGSELIRTDGWAIHGDDKTQLIGRGTDKAKDMVDKDNSGTDMANGGTDKHSDSKIDRSDTMDTDKPTDKLPNEHLPGTSSLIRASLLDLLIKWRQLINDQSDDQPTVLSLIKAPSDSGTVQPSLVTDSALITPPIGGQSNRESLSPPGKLKRSLSANGDDEPIGLPSSDGSRSPQDHPALSLSSTDQTPHYPSVMDPTHPSPPQSPKAAIEMSAMRHNAIYQFIYRVLGNMLFVSGLPFVIVLLLTIKIVCLVRESDRQRQKFRSSASQQLKPAGNSNSNLHPKSTFQPPKSPLVSVNSNSTQLAAGNLNPRMTIGGSKSPTSPSPIGGGLAGNLNFNYSDSRPLNNNTSTNLSRTTSTASSSNPQTTNTKTARSWRHAHVVLTLIAGKFLLCYSLPVVINIIELTSDQRKYDSDQSPWSRVVIVLVDLSNFLIVLDGATNAFFYFSWWRSRIRLRDRFQAAAIARRKTQDTYGCLQEYNTGGGGNEVSMALLRRRMTGGQGEQMLMMGQSPSTNRKFVTRMRTFDENSAIGSTSRRSPSNQSRTPTIPTAAGGGVNCDEEKKLSLSRSQTSSL